MIQMRSVWLILAVLLAVPAAHAQWKWKDKQGHINVSDLPPPLDVPDKDVLARPEAGIRHAAASAAAAATSSGAASGAASAARADRPRADPELEARRKAAEKGRADKGKAESERVAAERAANCQRARSQLTTLESGQRLARVNDKGEREILDDRSRAQEMQTARDLASSNCQ
jgi:hypothetical protein